MKRAAIYMRVSTDQQAREGDSIPAQREALLRYVNEAPDLILAGEYLDDGVSGQKIDRDELQRLLDDVRAGRIDMIVFTKLDRWFRSIKHYLATQEILDRHGVTWTAIWEPIYDTTTPQGRLILAQMMSIAQFEAENTSARIKAVMAYKVQQGEVVNGTVTTGYRREGKQLVPDPETAPRVLDIFKHYAATGNLSLVCRYAADVHGIVITRRGMRMLLTNRRYIGEYRDNPRYCPAIVPRDLFEDVQAKLKINIKSSVKYEYIFSGLLVCAECGARMSAYKQQGVSRYRCPKNDDAPPKCANTHSISESVLERYMLDHIRPAADKVIASAEVAAAPIRDAAAKKAAIERKIERLKTLYINDLIGLDEYKADRARLEEQLQPAPDPDPVQDLEPLRAFLTSGWEATYHTLTIPEKRILWRGIVRRIQFKSGKDMEICFV